MCSSDLQAGIAEITSKENAAAARKQAAHKRTIGTHNAGQLRDQALRLIRKGNQQENEVRRKGSEMISSQRASFGAGNIAVDSGSAARIQVDTARMSEVDSLRVRETHLEGAQSLDKQAYITLLESEAEADALETRADAFIKSGVNTKNALLDAASDAGDAGLLGALSTGVNAIDPSWFEADSTAVNPSLGTTDYGNANTFENYA